MGLGLSHTHSTHTRARARAHTHTHTPAQLNNIRLLLVEHAQHTRTQTHTCHEYYQSFCFLIFLLTASFIRLSQTPYLRRVIATAHAQFLSLGRTFLLNFDGCDCGTAQQQEHQRHLLAVLRPALTNTSPCAALGIYPRYLCLRLLV